MPSKSTIWLQGVCLHAVCANGRCMQNLADNLYVRSSSSLPTCRLDRTAAASCARSSFFAGFIATNALQFPAPKLICALLTVCSTEQTVENWAFTASEREKRALECSALKRRLSCNSRRCTASRGLAWRMSSEDAVACMPGAQDAWFAHALIACPA